MTSLRGGQLYIKMLKQNIAVYTPNGRGYVSENGRDFLLL
jgi:hypothetical protein